MVDFMLGMKNFYVQYADGSVYDIEVDGCYKRNDCFEFITHGDGRFRLDKNYKILKSGYDDGIWEIESFKLHLIITTENII